MTSGIANQKINRTVIVPNLLSGTNIGTWQADYPLTGRDYEHLRNGKPITLNWANSIFLASIGIGLTLMGKFISQYKGSTVVIYHGEWTALACGLTISNILYLIGLLLPNDRKLIMKQLKNHFDSSPKKRHMVQDGEK